MSSTTSDVVVIGAGIVGAACARAFARERLRVTLIESETIGGGATATGMGHVVVLDDSQAQFALCRYSQQLWYEIVDQLPADCEYEPCGTLWVAADEEEMEAVGRKERFYRQHGVAVEVLDPAGLAEAEPNLRGGLAGGLRVPGDLVIYPPCVARWLIEQAQALGAEVRVGVSVVELSADGVRLSDGSFVWCAATVNAAGTRVADLTPGVQMRPRKGHLIITERYPGFLNHEVIELGYLKSAHSLAADSVAMNIQPRHTGQLLIGSSRQLDDTTSGVDPNILGRMVRRALEYFPGIARLSAVRTWTGLRATTDDKLPLVGPAPGRDRVYLATGHEGLGITMSLGTAGLLVDQVMKRDSAIPHEPYLPSRFGNGHAHE